MNEEMPFGLARQTTHAALSSEDLNNMGKQAADAYLSCGTPLNQAVVKLAQQHASISPHQVMRVVEYTNQETFQRLFDDNEKYACDKNIDFPLADPRIILHELNDGARPHVMTPPPDDYSQAPVKLAHADVEADMELCRAFGMEPESPAMEKEAILDVALGAGLGAHAAGKGKRGKGALAGAGGGLLGGITGGLAGMPLGRGPMLLGSLAGGGIGGHLAGKYVKGSSKTAADRVLESGMGKEAIIGQAALGAGFGAHAAGKGERGAGAGWGALGGIGGGIAGALPGGAMGSLPLALVGSMVGSGMGGHYAGKAVRKDADQRRAAERRKAKAKRRRAAARREASESAEKKAFLIGGTSGAVGAGEGKRLPGFGAGALAGTAGGLGGFELAKRLSGRKVGPMMAGGIGGEILGGYLGGRAISKYSSKDKEAGANLLVPAAIGGLAGAHSAGEGKRLPGAGAGVAGGLLGNVAGGVGGAVVGAPLIIRALKRMERGKGPGVLGGLGLALPIAGGLAGNIYGGHKAGQWVKEGSAEDIVRRVSELRKEAGVAALKALGRGIGTAGKAAWRGKWRSAGKALSGGAKRFAAAPGSGALASTALGAGVGAAAAGPDQRLKGALMGGALGGAGGLAARLGTKGMGAVGKSAKHIAEKKGKLDAASNVARNLGGRSLSGGGRAWQTAAGAGAGGLLGGAAMQKSSSDLTKEAMDYAMEGRPKADLVLNDLCQATSVARIKQATADRGQYPEANPFGDLIRIKQQLTKMAEDAQDAVAKNKALYGEALSKLAHETKQYLLMGGNMGAVAHAMGTVTPPDAVKVAMKAIMPELQVHGLDPVKAKAETALYDMVKGAQARPVNPANPIVQAYASMVKLAEGHATLSDSFDKVCGALRDVEGTLKEAMVSTYAAER